MNRLPAVIFSVLTLGFIAMAPLALAQTNRNQMLEAANTARMQAKMEQATGYSAPESAPRASQTYTPITNSSSNRDYDQRDQDAALARSRRMKEAMREATSSSPSIDYRSGQISTGITDGTWQTDRLARIRDGYDGVREEAPRECWARWAVRWTRYHQKKTITFAAAGPGNWTKAFIPWSGLVPNIAKS